MGLRLLNGGEEWASQCLVGPAERGASLHLELLDTWLSWELGMGGIPWVWGAFLDPFPPSSYLFFCPQTDPELPRVSKGDLKKDCLPVGLAIRTPGDTAQSRLHFLVGHTTQSHTQPYECHLLSKRCVEVRGQSCQGWGRWWLRRAL